MPRADVTIFNVSADEPGGTDVIVQLTGAEAAAQASAVTAASQSNDTIVTLTGAGAVAEAGLVTGFGQGTPGTLGFPRVSGGFIGNAWAVGYAGAVGDYQREGAAKNDILFLNLNPDIVPRTTVPGGMMSGPDIVAALKALNPDVQIFDYHIIQEVGNSAGSWNEAGSASNKLHNESGPPGAEIFWDTHSEAQLGFPSLSDLQSDDRGPYAATGLPVNDWWARKANGEKKATFQGSNSPPATNITDFVVPDANGQFYPDWRADFIEGPLRVDPYVSPNSILAGMVGYASWEGCTGGSGFPETTVNTLADSGPGSLRTELASGNKWIRFSDGLTGTINLTSILTTTASNVTIDGRGANISIAGHGIRFVGNASNAIVMYLKFIDHDDETQDQLEFTTNPDGGYDKAWVYKCSFTGLCDENISVSAKPNGQPGPMGITIQECFFDSCNRTWLCGNTETTITWGDVITVTAYRNHFKQCFQRHPRTRGSNVDMVNNFIDQWGSQTDTSGYGAAASQEASIRSEGNIWKARLGGSLLAMSKGPFFTDTSTGKCVSINDRFENGAIFNENRISEVTPRPYSITVATADAALEASVVAGAGWSAVAYPEGSVGVGPDGINIYIDVFEEKPRSSQFDYNGDGVQDEADTYYNAHDPDNRNPATDGGLAIIGLQSAAAYRRGHRLYFDHMKAKYPGIQIVGNWTTWVPDTNDTSTSPSGDVQPELQRTVGTSYPVYSSPTPRQTMLEGGVWESLSGNLGETNFPLSGVQGDGTLNGQGFPGTTFGWWYCHNQYRYGMEVAAGGKYSWTGWDINCLVRGADLPNGNPTWDWVPSSSTNFAMMRWGLCMTLLDDGYYGGARMQVGTTRAGKFQSTAAFDEYGTINEGVTGLVKGHLGQPLEPRVITWFSGSQHHGLMTREFENGRVITTTSKTNSIAVPVTAMGWDGLYNRINGAQDPTWNNGQPLVDFIMPPIDGIIVVNV